MQKHRKEHQNKEVIVGKERFLAIKSSDEYSRGYQTHIHPATLSGPPVSSCPQQSGSGWQGLAVDAAGSAPVWLGYATSLRLLKMGCKEASRGEKCNTENIVGC